MIDYATAVKQDLPRITALLHACALPADDLTSALLTRFLTAQADGRIVGCAGLEPLEGSVALIRSLAVQPDRRGLGIASRLCDEIEAQARAAGIVALYLLTTTASGYFAARGYHRVDRDALPASVRATAQFVELCPTNAVAMKKDVASGL
jgi:amino-acid N-acetyltransferase